MSAGTASASPTDLADGCGRAPGDWGCPGGVWPLLPLAIAAAIVGTLVVLRAVGILPFGAGAAPYLGPILPIGLVLAILLAVLLVRLRIGGVFGSRGGYPARSAEEIVRRRYARGEITEEEYRRRMATLTSR